MKTNGSADVPLSDAGPDEQIHAAIDEAGQPELADHEISDHVPVDPTKHYGGGKVTGEEHDEHQPGTDGNATRQPEGGTEAEQEHAQILPRPRSSIAGDPVTADKPAAEAAPVHMGTNDIAPTDISEETGTSGIADTNSSEAEEASVSGEAVAESADAEPNSGTGKDVQRTSMQQSDSLEKDSPHHMGRNQVNAPDDQATASPGKKDGKPKKNRRKLAVVSLALVPAVISGCAMTAGGSGAKSADSAVYSAMQNALQLVLPYVARGKFQESQDGQTSGMDLTAGQEVELTADGPNGSQVSLSVQLNTSDSLRGATVLEVADLQPGKGYNVFLRSALYSENVTGLEDNTGEKDVFDENNNLTGQDYTWHFNDQGQAVSTDQDAQFATALKNTVADDTGTVLSEPTPALPEIIGY